jgi:predicted outer membrane repeat protein
MYVSIASNATVNSCSFSGNFTVSTGGDNAGGAFVANAQSSVVFVDSLFSGNASATVGGGVGFNNAQADFDNCHFIGNTAAFSGGGAYLNNFATISFADCLFEDNSSFNGGGAVLTGSSQAQFLNCELSGNSALQAGGGVNVGNSSSATFINGLVSGNDAVFGGGIFAANNGTAEITNCTIAMNVASSTGGGIRLGINGGSAQVRNSVLWSNLPEQITVAGSAGPLTVTYSNVQGGFAGMGNINADPLFVDPANGDFRLGAGSPSIDAGDNFAVPDGIKTDLDGNPRFVDDPDTPDTGNGDPPIVDMGAYEFQLACAPADLNCDGAVDVFDLLILLGAWGPCPDCPKSPCQADLNDDCAVDVFDLLILLGEWG